MEMLRLRHKVLVVFTQAQVTELFGGNEGRQVLSYLVQQGYVTREYQSEGLVYPKPQQKSDGVGYVPCDLDRLQKLGEFWREVKKLSVQTAQKPDVILERLSDAVFNKQKLCLFIPWGPRYEQQSDRLYTPEKKTFEEIGGICKKLMVIGICPEILLMPADVYAIEINGVEGESVSVYFSGLAEVAEEALSSFATLSVMPWSQIRGEEFKKYHELKKRTDAQLDSIMKAGMAQRMLDSARRFSKNETVQSARMYSIERVVEAEMIEQRWKPIKLSVVKKEKDWLDGPLPRWYLIKNTRPWLERTCEVEIPPIPLSPPFV